MKLKEIKDIILKTLTPYSPNKIGIFGSYSRNEQNENSDIDILVSFSGKVNLFDIIGMEQELSDKIGKKIDLITERSVNPKLKKYIDRDIIYWM